MDHVDATPTVVQASAVAAGTDNSFAVSPKGDAYAWGFSANYRTGLGTEEPMDVPRPLHNKVLRDQRLTLVACGGQFSILAGPAMLEHEDVGVTTGRS